MFLIATITMIIVLLLAFIATFYLGKSQKNTQNQQYDNKRIRTLILLSLIYFITMIGGMILIYFFVIR